MIQMVVATGRCERAVVELCDAWQTAGRAKFRLDCLVASAFFCWKQLVRSDGKSGIGAGLVPVGDFGLRQILQVMAELIQIA